MNQEIVSIIVPTLNAGKHLKNLFTSIQKQNYKNIEIIINDDLRTNDNTHDLIAAWKDLNITYINKNVKLGSARLEGAKIAKGKYLLHLDADQSLDINTISDCVNKVNTLKADGAFINEEIIGSRFWTKCKWLEKKCYWYDEKISSPRFFVTSSYFEAGGHSTTLMLSEDRDMYYRMKDAHKKLVWSDAVLFHNEEGISPIRTLKNKLFWAQSGFDYIKVRPKSGFAQLFLIFFRIGYFKHIDLLLKHPLLTIGMFYLKFMEVLGVVIGSIRVKLGKGDVKYKTTT